MKNQNTPVNRKHFIECLNNLSQSNLDVNIDISQNTKDKVNAFKIYIERKYAKKSQENRERREKWELFRKKMKDLNISSTEQELIKLDILSKEAEQLRNKRKKISPKDFDPLTIIGRGSFGEVRLCKWKDNNNEIVAIKKINKIDMLNKNQLAHVRAERDVLATCQNEWIVELKCSFQDEKYLYLVMEYLPGGDLMNLLTKKNTLKEDEARFYIAEAVLAVDSIHKLNYIHRDLKPDNILLDSSGHIKLSDFGLCKYAEIHPTQTGSIRQTKYEDLQQQHQKGEEESSIKIPNIGKKPNCFKRNRELAFTAVGTPDYIAPEIFEHNGYNETVDWWSLGVILYEMLIGHPPFNSDDPNVTYDKIMRWRNNLVIPSRPKISINAADLLRKLLTDPSIILVFQSRKKNKLGKRLGANGVEEIKAHPFFKGINWDKIREMKAPNIPEVIISFLSLQFSKVKSDIDTSNFEEFEEQEPWNFEDTIKSRRSRREDATFAGYTYIRNIESQRSSIVTVLEELETDKASAIRQRVSSMTNSMNNSQTFHKKENIDTNNITRPSFTYDHKNYSQTLQKITNMISKTFTKSIFKPRVEVESKTQKHKHYQFCRTELMNDQSFKNHSFDKYARDQKQRSEVTKTSPDQAIEKKVIGPSKYKYKKKNVSKGGMANLNLKANIYNAYIHPSNQNVAKGNLMRLGSPDIRYSKAAMPKHFLSISKQGSNDQDANIAKKANQTPLFLVDKNSPIGYELAEKCTEILQNSLISVSMIRQNQKL